MHGKSNLNILLYTEKSTRCLVTCTICTYPYISYWFTYGQAILHKMTFLLVIWNIWKEYDHQLTAVHFISWLILLTVVSTVWRRKIKRGRQNVSMVTSGVGCRRRSCFSYSPGTLPRWSLTSHITHPSYRTHVCKPQLFKHGWPTPKVHTCVCFSTSRRIGGS